MTDNTRHGRDIVDDFAARHAPQAPAGLQDRILAMAAQTPQQKPFRPFAGIQVAIGKLADGIAATGRMGWAPQLACAVFIVCVAFGAGMNAEPAATTASNTFSDDETTVIALAYGEFSGEGY